MEDLFLDVGVDLVGLEDFLGQRIGEVGRCEFVGGQYVCLVC